MQHTVQHWYQQLRIHSYYITSIVNSTDYLAVDGIGDQRLLRHYQSFFKTFFIANKKSNLILLELNLVGFFLNGLGTEWIGTEQNWNGRTVLRPIVRLFKYRS